jgi:hypothetical protein
MSGQMIPISFYERMLSYELVKVKHLFQEISKNPKQF